MGTQAASMQKLSDGTLQWTVGTIVISLRHLNPGVIYIAVTGQGEQVFLQELADIMETELATHGRLVVFANMAEANRFGAAARDAWAAWSKKHKQGLSAHCLVRSKLVEMGLSLVTMFSGSDLKSYSESERFLAAMRQVAPSATLPKLRDVA